MIDPITPRTAIMVAQADNKLRNAMAHLLHNLRRYMQAYPMMDDDKMPEHDVCWVSDIGKNGPEQTILAAMVETPELWMRSLPPEVCIVHRKMLEKMLPVGNALLGPLSPPDVTAWLAAEGANVVLNQAAQARYEREDRERRERYER